MTAGKWVKQGAVLSVTLDPLEVHLERSACHRWGCVLLAGYAGSQCLHRGFHSSGVPGNSLLGLGGAAHGAPRGVAHVLESWQLWQAAAVMFFCWDLSDTRVYFKKLAFTSPSPFEAHLPFTCSPAPLAVISVFLPAN